MVTKICLLLSIVLSASGRKVFKTQNQTPVVITTWKFLNATVRAWDVLENKMGSALDAVEAGCAVCEYEQCDFTVGYGGSPDENGETTLDSMIMDGTSMKVGGVGGLRMIKNAVGVARKVMENTKHSLLVGNSATNFARKMGFPVEDLATPQSVKMHTKWVENECQPNFWKNVSPDPRYSCGPYKPSAQYSSKRKRVFDFGEFNHDTIGMISIDHKGRLASATSTNGLKFKIPGRVGDSPVAGAGSYADDEVGGAAATGDGDVMMRFLPTFLAVEEMRRGKSAERAARTAMGRISAKYPQARGAIVVLKKDGTFGAACIGMEKFPYYVANPDLGGVKLFYKKCQ